MSGESTPSSEELKKYLKDAGMYEENMDFEDMLSYYKVVKCSESTAQQEKEKRSFHENSQSDADFSDSSAKAFESSPDLNFDSDIKEDELPSSKLTEKTTPKSCKNKLALAKMEKVESTSKLSKSNSPYKANKAIEYNAFDGPPLKHKPLDIILYERKYDLPPHCNPTLNKLTITQRAKLIRNFHKTILEKFYKLHCKSLNPAPWGRPIPSSDKFNGTLDRNSELDDDDFQVMNSSNDDENTICQEIYTSRHGRQTKRKVYTDLDEDNDMKKARKNDDKPFEIEKKSVSKRQSINKLSNQDIMKRSKLFNDPVKATRTEKMFDALKQNEKKSDVNQQHEKNESSSEDIMIESDSDTNIIQSSQETGDDTEFKPKEMPFIPRRIPPPIRGRRGIGSKRQLYSDVTKANGSPSSLASPKPTTSSPASSTATTVVEKTQKSTGGKTKCPICSQVFFQDEIEAHASSCGLFTESESNFDILLPSGNVKKIKCDVCDKEMIMNKDYEVHVKDCISKAEANEKL